MSAEQKIPILREALEPVYDAMREATYFSHGRSYELDEEAKQAPWRLRLCDKWSRMALPIAQQALTGMDVQLRHIACKPDRATRSDFGLPEWLYHEYLIDESNMADPLVIDGTWQQFLDPDQPTDASPLLIAQASQTRGILLSAGVNPGLLYGWRVDPSYWCRQATRPPYQIFGDSKIA